jgi:VanZ family protein
LGPELIVPSWVVVALTHVEGGRAWWGGDLFDKGVKLMKAWIYLNKVLAVVVAALVGKAFADDDQSIVAKSGELGTVRMLAWLGMAAIFVLSVVPAEKRPLTGIGQGIEHFCAFGLSAGAFAVAYRLPPIRLLLMPVVFCGSIELIQLWIPSRHARLRDFVIDLVGSYFGIGVVALRSRLRTSACR